MTEVILIYVIVVLLVFILLMCLWIDHVKHKKSWNKIIAESSGVEEQFQKIVGRVTEKDKD